MTPGFHEVKLRGGKYMVPVKLAVTEDHIEFAFKFNRALLNEVKVMDGARWLGYEETNPRKVWRAKNNQRNTFQLRYLMGENPYTHYDNEIIRNTYERPLYIHQNEMADFMLTRHYCLVAGEQGCVTGNATVHINRAGKGFECTLRDLFLRFNGKGRWDPSIDTQIRALKGEQFGLVRVLSVLQKGYKRVSRLVLKSGKSLVATPDHEILTANGYKPLEALEPGDSVTCNGTWIDKDGYVRVGGLKHIHPKWTSAGVGEHILVMEEEIGRYIEDGEIVHHVNGIKTDNRIENLELLANKSDHAKRHSLVANLHGGRVQIVPHSDTIITVEPAGYEVVYDVVCEHPHHNFVANGIIVHNCGKTLSAIEVMERSHSDWFYVAPKSGLMAVERELRIWRAMLRPRLITYEGLVRIVKDWTPGTRPPRGVFYDESSRVKNPTAQRSQAAAKLADMIREVWGESGFVLLMSGTPAPRSPVDWWHQCEIACPGFLREGNINKFRERLGVVVTKESPIGGKFPSLESWLDDDRKCAKCGHFEEEPEHSASEAVAMDVEYHPFVKSENEVAKLYKRMSGLVLVKRKKDCLDLPDKIYREVVLEPSEKMLNIARALVAKASTTISALTLLRELSDGFQYQDVESGRTVCPQCSGSKRIRNPMFEAQEVWKHHEVPDGFRMEEIEEFVTCDTCNGVGDVTVTTRIARQVECPKEAALVDLLDEHFDVGRLVVYAGFTGSIDRVVTICAYQKWQTIRMDGRGISATIPGDPLTAFQDQGDKYPRVCFVAHPQSGGMGLTLTASPSIVYYSNDFNAESRVQSEDRIHRIGMDVNRGATIIDLIHLPTDRLVLDNLKKKRVLQAMSLGEINACFSGATQVQEVSD